MRGRSPASPALVVALVLIGSAGVRFATSTRLTVPWIAPDEMLYGLLGESLWHTGRLDVLGTASPFYSVVTPALVGAPLSVTNLVDGIAIAQALQCLAMASVVIPVYLWARRVASPWWAVTAAALCVAGPALTYGGLLMTEALFYPAVAWALYALALALERPSAARQGAFVLAVTVAAAVRTQGLVLLPAFVLAVGLQAAQRRSVTPVRPLLPLAAGLVTAGLGIALVRLAAPDAVDSRELVGAYAGATDGSVGLGLVGAIVWHLGALAVMVVVGPFVATALLGLAGLRGRIPTVAGQAFVATTLSYTALLVVEVGVFAVTNLDHVSQRYLVTGVPPLLVGLAAWVGAGAPRGRVSAWVVAATCSLLVVLIPPERLLPRVALHDALSTTLLLHLHSHGLLVRGTLALVAAASVCALLLLPVRLLWVVAALALCGLVAQSVDAWRTAERLSAREQRDAFGGASPTWLDDAGLDRVTLLITGDRTREAVARTVFWNRGIREVLRLPGAASSVPPSPPLVSIDPGSGLVRDSAGHALVRGLIAAPTTYAFVGERVATRSLGTATAPPIGVWRVAGAVRVASVTSGLMPNGDFHGTFHVVVPGCVPGHLEVTFIGKSGDPVAVRVDGIPVMTVEPDPGATPTASIPAPAAVDGTTPCVFDLTTQGYVGTTRIAYVRSRPVRSQPVDR